MRRARSSSSCAAYKRVRVETTQKVGARQGAELVSGDLVEVELEIESKNDYDYLCLEDSKAASFEAHQVRSGCYREGHGRPHRRRLYGLAARTGRPRRPRAALGSAPLHYRGSLVGESFRKRLSWRW